MAALVGVISKVFASGFLKSVLGRILISVALGAVQTLLAKARADRIAAANRGIRGEKTLSGSKNPMGFILGRYATGGVHVVTPYTSGTNNNYMTYVIMLGCRRGATLSKMIVSGEVVQLDTTTNATYGRNVLGKYAGKMWVKFRNGTETTADTFLTSTFGSHPDRPWTSDMIGRDAPHAIVTFFYDDELYNQYPEVRFEVTDTPLYDIRKDTTAGGSGAHRWSDPTTWEPTTNPVVMIYNILRGIPIAGVGTWGGEAEAEDFRFTEWAAAMNKAQGRYQAGFEVYLSDKPDAVISELLKSCSGQIADVGGTWRVSVGAPDAAVYYFSDEDLIVSENTQFDPFPGVEDTTNTVVATFVNPEALWEVSEAITTTNADFIATDDARILETDLSLSAVFDSVQAQDLATTMLADNRRFRSHITTLPLSAMFVEPLDTVGWTSEYNGYNAKLFEIGQCSADVIGCIPTVTSRERDPNDYDFAGGVPYVPVSTVTTPIPTVVDGFTVTGHIITDGSSNRRPALRITWGAGSMGFARSIRYRVRLTASPATMTNEGAHADPSSGVLIISEGILPAVSYQVSVKVVARGRSNPWSSWITVVSPDVRFSAEDFDLTTTPATPTGLSLSSALTATGGVRLTATWTAVAGTDIRYDIRLRQNGGNDVVFSTSTNRYEWDVLPNTNYVAAVRAVGRLLVTSVYSAEVSHTTTKDSVAPAVPTGLAVTGGFETLWLKWNDVSDSDLDFYEVFESATSTPAPTAGSTPTYTTAANTLVLTGLSDGVTKHFWVRSVDTSNNKSAWTARAQGTTVALVAADVSGILQEASYSVNLVPPVVVATLPTTGNFQGRLALLTTDNKLYRYTGTAWTAAVPAVDITGQVVASQIADAAITTAKFASGIEPVEIVATLPTTGNFAGRIAFLTTDNKLYRHTGTAWTTAVPAVDITGQLAAAQIASLEASKITGQLTDAQISDLSAAKMTGQITGTQITDNAISAPKIAAGAVIAGKIAADAVTAGTIAANAVTAAKIAAGAVEAAKIAAGAVEADKIAANAVTADKIAANAVTAGKIAADAVTAGKVAAGAINAREIASNAITTEQMAVRSFNNLIENPDFENGALHWTNPSRIVNDPANALRGSWVYTYVSFSSANALVSRSNYVEALPGDSFYVRGSFKNSAGSTGNFYIEARFYDSANAALSTPRLTWAGENASWSEKEMIVTAPANAVRMTVNLYTAGVGTAYWDGISLMKAAEGKLIVDGSIIATKIAAEAITAEKLSVLARDFVNDPTKRNSIAGWGGADDYGVGGSAAQTYSSAEDALALTNAGLSATRSTTFEMDHGKIYRIAFRVKKDQAVGTIYAGLSGYTDSTLGASGGVSSYAGTQVFTPYNQSRVSSADIASFYFFNQAATTSYVDHVVYLVGANRSVDECPQFEGSSSWPFAKASLSCRHVALRFLNWDNGTTTTTLFVQSISVTELGGGKIVAQNIAANAITAGKIDTDAVTAGTIAAGAITAREIAAGAITASKIVVTDFENLAGDANFDDTSFWTTPATTTFIAATAGFTSRNVMQLSGASNAFVIPNGMTFQVKAGDKLFMSLEGQITGGSGSCYAQVQFSANTDFSSPQYLSPPTITSTSVTTVSGEITVPGGMRYARLRLVKGNDGVTQCRFGNVIMRRMNGGELIVDGAVTAAKIAAGAVVAEKLSVLASNLVNNPTRTNSLEGWGGVTETGTGGNAAQTYNATEDALALVSAGGNYATISNTFPIDHNKIYRIAFKVRKDLAVGNIYVGVSGYTTWRLGSAGTASGAGTELFARHDADRVFISDTNNPYMLDTGSPSTTYLECVAYLIGANRSIADCPDHVGVVNRPYIKASSTVGHVAIRFLNWNNGTTTTTLFAKDISVSEVGTGQIVADNIKANAITAGKIDTDAVTAGTIAAGAITAREIAAQTIVASKIAVTDLTNLVLNNTLDTSEGWALEASVAVANAPAGMIRTRALEIGAVTVTRFARYTAAVDAGAEYVLSCQAAGTAGGKFTVRLGVIFRDAAGVQLTNPGATVATLTDATPVDVWDDFTAPAGAVTAEFRFGRTASGSEVGLGYIVNPTVRRKNGAELIVDGSITATKVGTNEIITTTANIKDATITDAKIVELSAAKLTAGTALAASITVNAKALSTIKTEAETGAQDPVTRINAGTTQINPGKIVISGATTLADWRMGGDLTKINGGSISANTISANKLTIGSRGITTGIEFEHNSPAANSVSWTAGAVRYINDAGTSTTTNVVAGNAAWTSGVLYIYWVKGATTLSTTTSQATALGADNVILATYAGGTNLTGNYGRTIIDGSSIKTGTIDANRLTVTELSSITANVGILRTATSGERLEIRGDRILVYDASNVLRVRLGNLA